MLVTTTGLAIATVFNPNLHDDRLSSSDEEHNAKIRVTVAGALVVLTIVQVC